MHKLLSVSIAWHTETPRILAVDEILSRDDDDWIRLTGSQWYVWTDRPVTELAEIIRSLVVPTGHCIITSLEPVAANGTAPQWIWDWLNEKMRQKANQQFESTQHRLPNI